MIDATKGNLRVPFSLFRHLRSVSLLPILLSAMISSSLPDLSALQWKSRVLVLFEADSAAFGESAGRNLSKEQQHLLEAQGAGLRERQVEVYVVSSNKGSALRHRLRVSDSAFAAVLIGKDGGVKWRSDRVFSSERLFHIIDAMPMRRKEMQSAALEPRR